MYNSSIGDDKVNEKYKRLKEYIASLGSVAVAFSGGVDSTFLLKTAHDVLGGKAIAITEQTEVFPQRERSDADEFCKKEGIEQIIIKSDVLGIDGFAENPKNRCYLCKRALFKDIKKTASERGIAYVCEGSNVDDDSDYRPGMKAVAELDIKSPLKYAGLTKAEIRALSREFGLNTWDKSSFACLASRFVYGERITKEKLDMVERAEQLLYDEGFSQFRVRMHGDMARIEIKPDEFERLLGMAERVNSYMRSLGFSYASLDLGGYKTGNMNVGI